MRKYCKKTFYKSPKENFGCFITENLKQRPQKLEHECNIFFKMRGKDPKSSQSTVHISQLSLFMSTF